MRRFADDRRSPRAYSRAMHAGRPDSLASALQPAGSGAAPKCGAEVVLDHVHKRFGERVTALDDVSFTIAPGELVLLSGHSGAGKSTTLNLIAGLDTPDSGQVRVDGVDVAALPDTARYRREVVGFVFQLHHLILTLTAEENVEMALIPAGLPRAERLARARAALAEVGLVERGTHLPRQLSGGERQRVAIARAIVNGPRLLLADEPTGALDSAATTRTLALLGELRRERGMTVVLVSYEPEAEPLADRTLHLHDGRVTG